jgi:hypothetical protein
MLMFVKFCTLHDERYAKDFYISHEPHEPHGLVIRYRGFIFVWFVWFVGNLFFRDKEEDFGNARVPGTIFSLGQNDPLFSTDDIVRGCFS